MRLRWFMRALVAATCLASSARANDYNIEYRVSVTKPHTQIVHVTMDVGAVYGDTLDVALPVWRPGRYQVMNLAAGVRSVKAFAPDGKELSCRKIDKSTWRIETNGSTKVSVKYSILCNSLGRRTRHVDDTHAFLSGSAVFFYIPDRRNEPLRLVIEPFEDWRVATGLARERGSAYSFIADNYDVLMDSPIEFGKHETIEFTVLDTPHEIAIWGKVEYDREKIIRDFTKLIETQHAMWGSFPYERYIFLVHASNQASGGTEHLNSTIMQTRPNAFSSTAAFNRFLGLASHEYFHTWNVKALRPAGMLPYDYARENYTKLLWVCEGMTSYYSDVMLVRAGLKTPDSYISTLARNISSHRNRPGRLVQSVEMSSFDEWLSGGPDRDAGNTAISIYAEGSVTSLVMDLQLRRVSENRVSLDDVMADLYRSFPLTGPGYTPDDLRDTMSGLSGHDFEEFFEKYIRGTEELEFETALETAGLRLARGAAARQAGGRGQRGGRRGGRGAAGAANTGPISVYHGLGLTAAGGFAAIRSIRSDSPAIDAGLMLGDEIVAVDGQKLQGANLDASVAGKKPGDTVKLDVFRRNELRTFYLQLRGRRNTSFTLRRVPQPTDLQKAVYESWLGQSWPGSNRSRPTSSAADKVSSGE